MHYYYYYCVYFRRPWNRPYQGWANYGPRAACGPRDHFMRPAGTCRNSYSSLIVLIIALIPLHCVIHQESLWKGALNIKHVTDSIVNVVNLIRARGLNHRQFRALLADLETEHLDVLYHNHVRWLSLGKVLRRVWEKSIQCDFSTNIVDEEWRLDFKFAIDIMEKLNKLNVKLQGNGLFAHEM